MNNALFSYLKPLIQSFSLRQGELRLRKRGFPGMNFADAVTGRMPECRECMDAQELSVNKGFDV